MELEGVVQNGVIVLDGETALPEGTRVRIEPVPAEKPKTFGERMARFCGAIKDAPAPALGATTPIFRPLSWPGPTCNRTATLPAAS